MPIIDKIASILTGGAGKFVTDTINTLSTNQEEKAAMLLAWETEKNNAAEQIEIAHNAEMNSARDMQKAALSQGDTFSKRFVYYLAAGVILGVFIFDYLFFFVHFPADNKQTIDSIAFLLNGTGLISILGFFYGSTKSSREKDETLAEAVKSLSKK